MKRLFLLLFFANIGFAALIQMNPGQSGDAKLSSQQVNPEKIKLVTSYTPEKLTSTKPGACLEWGTFAGNELARAEAALAKLELGPKLTQHSVEETIRNWVYIPPLKTKQDAEKKIGELKTLGITDYFLVQEDGQWRYAISLGIFKTEEAAKNFLAELQQKGVRSAIVGERGHQVKQVMFTVREPGEAVQARLVDLQRDFPGSELKAAACR